MSDENPCLPALLSFWEVLYKLCIIIRKNFQIWTRRYIALTIEIIVPIIFTVIVVRVNTRNAIFRTLKLDELEGSRHQSINQSIEQFYIWGTDYSVDKILNHTLCNSDKDSGSCYIGYVADDETVSLIFENYRFLSTSRFRNPIIWRPGLNDTNGTIFVRFPSENAVTGCLAKPENCSRFNYSRATIHLFRGAVIFETGLKDEQVKYKIRLLEQHYNSLRHVMKTARLTPSIFDKRDYTKSYLASGFLSLQFHIDRMIVSYLDTSSTIENLEERLSLREMPHRHLDQFHFDDDELLSKQDEDIFDFVGKKVQDELSEPTVVQITVTCTIVLILALTFIIPFEQRRVVNEKESGLTMLLRVTGMSHRMQWLGNFLSVVLLYGVIVTGMVFLLTKRFSLKEGAVFELTTPSLLWILLMLFVINLISLCSLFSTFFDQSEIAMTATTAFILVTFIAPAYHIHLLYKELHFWVKMLLCIHPLIGLQIVFQLLIGYEELALETSIFSVANGVPTDPMKLIYIMIMLIIETWTFFSMATYLNLVLPSKAGAVYPWYYPCTASHYDRRRKTKVAPGHAQASKVEPRPWHKSSNLISPGRDNAGTDSITRPEGKSKSVFINVEETTKKKGGGKKGNAASQKSTKVKIDESTADKSPFSEGPRIEPYPDGEEPTVETFNLTKKYGSNVAVNNINLKLFHGEIVALIGQNGCGKSTLLNMFSGHTSPTSGSAKIGGMKLTTQLMQIQSFIGMCPQNPVLFDDLTTFEHLTLFGRLRGLRGDDIAEQATEFVEKLNLLEMRNMYVRNLSKGDARKLSLAIALIGKPEVVILDEPTGWMDYYSRRTVWDLLLKIRSNHTIIFSTAFMDEAELYGDKVGVMARGKLELMGSQPFLRRYLGLGYSLKMTIDPKRKTDSEAILNVVRGTMPSASLNTFPFSSNADHICNVNLPEDVYSANSMSAMFTDFAKVRESLGIMAFSVSHATMDELYLALMRKVDPQAEEDIDDDEEFYGDLQKLEGCLLSLRQFWDVLKKRMLFSIRNKTFTFFTTILPAITTCFAVARLSSSIDLTGREGKPLELSLNVYKDHLVPIITSDTFPEKLLRSIFGDFFQDVKKDDITGTLIQVDYQTLRSRYVIGMSPDFKNPARVQMHYSPYHFHASAMAINAYFTILLKKADPTRSIMTTNEPISHPYFAGPYFDDDSHAIDTASALSGVSWAFAFSFAAVYPMLDRFSQMKHLQLMAGISSFTYWLACLVGDAFMLTLGVLMVLTFSKFYPPAYALNKFKEDGLDLIRFLLLPTTIYCGTVMMHFFSHLANSVSGGFSLFITTGLISGTLLPYFTSSPISGTNLLGSKTVSWAFITNPFHSTAVYVRKLYTTLLANGKCNYFTELGEKYYCDENLTAQEVKDSYEVNCCRNCYKIPGAENCYDRFEIFGTPWSKRYYSYESYMKKEPSPIHDIRDVSSRAVFYEALSCFLLGVLFHSLCVLLDTDVWKYFVACVFGLRGRAFQTEVEDEDVNDEADRVDDMVESGELSEDMLVTHAICKTIGIFPVIHNISFGVHPGECFGILGVNGAGKSTLFNLLTGSTVETFGNVYSIDCSLTSGRTRLMQKMGYLPHTDSTTVKYLTLEEHLQLFSRLRGQTSKESKAEIIKLLRKLKIEKYKDKRMESLSAGVQRTVSTAMAIVGKSPIVLLDEPTSLSDPLARRNFWKLMKDAKKSGQTVLFSSHRIPECEELCDRVAVLIDGKFQCIGSPSDLKNKFGGGFKLLIKLDPDHAENREYVSSLSNTVVDIFNPCFLRDRRRNVIQYVIQDKKISWDYLFQQMEHIKLRYTDLVEDYTFSETRLEEVFLSFVILQYCGRIKKIRSGGGCC